MLLGSIKKEWELANLGAHSWGNCALSSNVYRQENYEDFECFIPQVAYYSLQFNPQIQDISVNWMKT